LNSNTLNSNIQHFSFLAISITGKVHTILTVKIIVEENLKYHLFYPIDKKDGMKKTK